MNSLSSFGISERTFSISMEIKNAMAVAAAE